MHDKVINYPHIYLLASNQSIAESRNTRTEAELSTTERERQSVRNFSKTTIERIGKKYPLLRTALRERVLRFSLRVRTTSRFLLVENLLQSTFRVVAKTIIRLALDARRTVLAIMIYAHACVPAKNDIPKTSNKFERIEPSI